jgi:predicted GNAT superfamily acetyltransferase
MSDAINAGDASDRLEAVWDLTRPLPDRGSRAGAADRGTPRATHEEIAAGRVLLRDVDGEPLPTGLAPEEGAVLQTPADYEGLRAADRPRSLRWRQAVREQLGAVYAAGLQVGAVDPEGYRVVRGDAS